MNILNNVDVFVFYYVLIFSVFCVAGVMERTAERRGRKRDVD